MKKIFILNITVILLFTACKKDFLNRQPLDAYSNSTLWTSASDATAALNGVYAGWTSNWSDNAAGWADGFNVIYFDCFSDNAYSQYPWEGFQSYGNGLITPTDGNADNLWNYTTIQKCNFFLANIGITPMDATLKKQMIAQVRFIRAYQYFMISQLYGDVPLVTTSLTPAQANVITQTPKAVVTKFILSELAAAATDLATNYSGADAGHITKGAALALKVRVELYSADYADCISDAQLVMQMGYKLHPSYTDLFRIQNINNSEDIVDVQYKENDHPNGTLGVMPSASYGGWGSIDPLQSLVNSYEMSNGKVITDPASGYDPNNPYANRDPRLTATIVYPGESYGGIYYNSIDPAAPDYYLGGSNSKSGYIPKKFTSNLTDYDNMWNTGLNIMIIRYAEVLLSYAEAKIESGQIDASVYTAINEVRNRAGMPSVDQSVYNNQASLRSLIRRERRVELAMEGLRWFDIQRWQIGSQVMSGPVYGARLGTVNATNGQLTLTTDSIKVENRIFSNKNYLWPVPQSEINIDKNLKQNTGY
ncbi:MAG: RagB/SusD family nutrient uptake outer membrane protein [Mucilaginibacter sp.]